MLISPASWVQTYSCQSVPSDYQMNYTVTIDKHFKEDISNWSNPISLARYFFRQIRRKRITILVKWWNVVKNGRFHHDLKHRERNAIINCLNIAMFASNRLIKIECFWSGRYWWDIFNCFNWANEALPCQRYSVWRLSSNRTLVKVSHLKGKSTTVTTCRLF